MDRRIFKPSLHPLISSDQLRRVSMVCLIRGSCFLEVGTSVITQPLSTPLFAISRSAKQQLHCESFLSLSLPSKGSLSLSTIRGLATSTSTSNYSRRKMGDHSIESGNEAEAPKRGGLEGTGLNLPTNLHMNLKKASSDKDIKDLLDHLKRTKHPFWEFYVQAIINYGASWCRVCSQVLPTFCHLSNKFPNHTFIYADIDECPDMTQTIRYTPTFHFFRDGEKVDEMLGAGDQRLHDRLWLHS
ncbi:thioredoxin-like 3-3 isoform X4 [Amborella trichopoda]|uniref:thioredoxin-like 3-3 isoform X4 n=1 Tax=Amborella trichopoda TaxID=13333 RepID=UPI0009C136A6|nr:thioredoxin-like 3-3 isoform X4 [Amborella trichopoda]|eukprot:XP_020529627.1 thioredoxin-like 3-3 isoform X4 [Amborella trichopoda]